MTVEWLTAEECTPPHAVTHPEKRASLAEAFSARGWSVSAPVLVGYRTDTGEVQLLSGSHRWSAAMAAGIRLPVVIHPDAAVRAAWGDLAAWRALMASGERAPSVAACIDRVMEAARLLRLIAAEMDPDGIYDDDGRYLAPRLVPPACTRGVGSAALEAQREAAIAAGRAQRETRR